MIDDGKPENLDSESIFIEKEMENSFLDYAMSVIVSRALQMYAMDLSQFTGELFTQ